MRINCVWVEFLLRAIWGFVFLLGLEVVAYFSTGFEGNDSLLFNLEDHFLSLRKARGCWCNLALLISSVSLNFLPDEFGWDVNLECLLLDLFGITSDSLFLNSAHRSTRRALSYTALSFGIFLNLFLFFFAIL